MKCPFCHEAENRVIDSRLSKDANMIRRRRECEKCGRRFTTYERVEETMPLVVSFAQSPVPLVSTPSTRPGVT